MTNALGGLSSRVISVGELFRLGTFRPASVQRDFQWTEQNCDTLLADLCDVLDRSAAPDVANVEEPSDASEAREAGDDEARIDAELVPELPALAEPSLASVFLGAMVLSPADMDPAAGQYHVYDGLQRLTTLTLLVATVRDLIKADEASAGLHALLAVGVGSRLSLLSGHDVLRDVVEPGGAIKVARRRRAATSDTGQRLKSVVRFLVARLKDWNQARLAAFADGLVTNTFVSATFVADARLARQIFVTTNLHGVRLNRVDLLKGQLMDIAGDPGRAEAVRASWETAQDIVGDDMDAFLVAVDFIERREHQGVDCLTRLAAHLERIKGPAQIGGWVGALEVRARAWHELHEKMETPGPGPVDRDIWKLRFFWWTEWKPLALLWYAAYVSRRGADGLVARTTWQAFKRRFDALHGRCLALILADYTPNERAHIFAKAIQQARDGRDPLGRALAFFPDEIQRMRQSLIVPMTDDARRHATIRWIEASMWTDEFPAHLKSMQVEHVLPLRSAGNSQWRTDFPDEEDRYDAAHSLGNLACLDPKTNITIGNSDFVAKREAYRHAPEFKTIQQVAASDFWDGDMIRARERLLTDHVFETLALPVLAPGSRR